MAQVNTQAPANLMEMMSSPSPMMWNIAQNQVDQQRQGNELNMQNARQSADIERQKLPFELSQLGLQNRTSEAALPGVAANSSSLQDKATLSRDTMPEQHRTAIAKMAKEASDADLDVSENQVLQMLRHQDPAIRKQGESMYGTLKTVRAERDKLSIQHRNAMAQGEQRETGATARNEANNAAGRFKKTDKSTLAMGSRIDMENDPGKKLGMLLDASAQAAHNGRQEEADYYMARAQNLDEAVKLRAGANAKAGAIDIAANSKGTATNPTPSSMPKAQPGTPKPTTKLQPAAYKAWFDKMVTDNPDYTPEEIGALGKKKGYF